MVFIFTGTTLQSLSLFIDSSSPTLPIPSLRPIRPHNSSRSPGHTQQAMLSSPNHPNCVPALLCAPLNFF
ncbi:hypothetical protein CGRA01v4_11186 [Colletotrichum graminicola]|nr:hypothetical protein CGRA01v4_11186 [Colletotrichum graminicola]